MSDFIDVIHHVENVVVREYQVARNPGGGECLHAILVGAYWYAFLAESHRKWIYKKDVGSFDWTMASFGWTATDRAFRRIIEGTVVAKSRSGRTIRRGDRGKGGRPITSCGYEAVLYGLGGIYTKDRLGTQL